MQSLLDGKVVELTPRSYAIVSWDEGSTIRDWKWPDANCISKVIHFNFAHNSNSVQKYSIDIQLRHVKKIFDMQRLISMRGVNV